MCTHELSEVKTIKLCRPTYSIVWGRGASGGEGIVIHFFLIRGFDKNIRNYVLSNSVS